MKKFFSLFITTAVLYSWTFAQSTLTISGEVQKVIANMGVTVIVDSSVMYPNGGKLVTVRYPKGLLTGEAVISTDTLESGTIMHMTGLVSGGSQQVAGATKIIPLSGNSFRVVREVGGKEDIAYVFEKHRATRFYEEDKKIIVEQVLP